MQDGRPLARVTLWMMCMEHCLVQLSTLHSKRPFFNPRESHPLARTPLPSNSPSPTPAAEPQLLPALLPLAVVQLLHVARLGQVGGGPLPLSSEDTCFPVGIGCVGVGRVEQRGGGVQFMGWGVELPPGR